MALHVLSSALPEGSHSQGTVLLSQLILQRSVHAMAVRWNMLDFQFSGGQYLSEFFTLYVPGSS